MDASPVNSVMLAIIQERDLDFATRALHELDMPAIYLSSLGGFLMMRNATLLFELCKGEEATAIEALEKACQQRIEYQALPLESSPLPMPTPIPITVGGATIFILPVESFVEI